MGKGDKKTKRGKIFMGPTELQERKEVKAHSQMEIRPNPQKIVSSNDVN